MKKKQGKKENNFYTFKEAENADSPFYPEYNILLQTAEAVNNFYSIYKADRASAVGGPSTHNQQDLHRAMLVFACAGLDVFVKQLIKTKLSKLVEVDNEAKEKFQQFILRGGTDSKDQSNFQSILALALIDNTPRKILLGEYINSLTSNSLQSSSQLCRISDSSGLDKSVFLSKTKIASLDAAFKVRNEIVHEMDINILANENRKTGYRRRRQRTAPIFEKHTKTILGFAQDLLNEYKKRFNHFKIEVEKTTQSSQKKTTEQRLS